MIILDLALALLGLSVISYSIWGLFNGSGFIALLPLVIGAVFLYRAYTSYRAKKNSRDEYYANLKCKSCNSFGNMNDLFKNE